MAAPSPHIPKRIHQVWTGPNPPTNWMKTWEDAHPSWDYQLWDERRIAALGLNNAAVWRRFIDAGIYDAASDVARVEILYRVGGVYIDADSRCVTPLDEAPFMDAAFFATQEIQPNGKRFVTNAFMGAVAHHPILERYMKRISTTRTHCVHGGEGASFCCAWKTTGPLVLTSLVRNTDAVLLEPEAFFTRTITGEPLDGEHYGEHYWLSTGARSPEGAFLGARTYQEV